MVCGIRCFPNVQDHLDQTCVMPDMTSDMLIFTDGAFFVFIVYRTEFIIISTVLLNFRSL